MFETTKNIYPQFDNGVSTSFEMQFRLNENNRIKYYLTAEICERKAMSKGLSKYTVAFDYIHKVFIVSSATSGGTLFVHL